MSDFQGPVIEKGFPLGGEGWEFYLSDTPTTVIALDEGPLEGVGEVEETQETLSITVEGYGLSGLHPGGLAGAGYGHRNVPGGESAA